ncbi:hypothetical protein BKG80_03715 [Mycobacteroides chelonae]|uniref:hypothetical protein n=1 Tax=Mycobacteroides chelonae TaxID=1774 RepID=UPI0008A9064D|nr:hypothetical protein [Mycobacteroides chelonae]OHU42058.1 hypothetical protein BKG80_03715 [Mycobacteroides chelonae]
MEDEDETEPPVADWLLRLGSEDRASAILIARQSRDQLDKAAKYALRSLGTLTNASLLVMGLTTRAQGLHRAAIEAVEADNPYASFTLIRAYAENAAAALYAVEKPDKIDDLLGLGTSIAIGKITNHANQGSKRFGAFRGIYSQLSEYAHPTSRSLFASSKLAGGAEFHWASIPAFEFESDVLTACGWIVELATSNANLLAELGRTG